MSMQCNGRQTMVRGDDVCMSGVMSMTMVNVMSMASMSMSMSMVSGGDDDGDDNANDDVSNVDATMTAYAMRVGVYDNANECVRRMRCMLAGGNMVVAAGARVEGRRRHARMPLATFWWLAGGWRLACRR